MGYAATTIAFFGHRLDPAQAAAVSAAADALLGPGWASSCESDPAALSDSPLSLRSLDSDSRIHNTEGLEPGPELFHYAFGLELGSDGYGSSDDIASLLIASASDPDVAAAWSARAAPLLARAGLSLPPPRPLTINQVW